RYLKELPPPAARMLALAGDSDLFFIGRSPDAFFDYLSGLLLDTSWKQRLALLPFSWGRSRMVRPDPAGLQGLRGYLAAVGFDPLELATRRRPVAVVDLVASGGTFGCLLDLLHEWAVEGRSNWNVVRRRIRIVGITSRTRTNPNTWRWWQHATWTDLLPPAAIRNVSIPACLWTYFTDSQGKVTESYT